MDLSCQNVSGSVSDSKVAELKSMIKPYIENDPSAFYTIEEFERATTLQTVATEESKSQTEETGAENKENRRGGFGNGKSIINVTLERLENLKAQFEGTAEKSTLSNQSGFGGGFPGGFGGVDFGGGMPEFKREEPPQMPENFNPAEILGNFDPEGVRPENGKRPQDGFGNPDRTPFRENQNQANAPVRVHVDGHLLTFETNPVIENDTTLVGFRSILEELGATVEWDEAMRTVTATKDDTKIVLTIDFDVAYVNGESVTLLAAPAIIENSTMVPVRFISEQLGMKVTWYGDTKLITITSK